MLTKIIIYKTVCLCVLIFLTSRTDPMQAGRFKFNFFLSLEIDSCVLSNICRTFTAHSQNIHSTFAANAVLCWHFETKPKVQKPTYKRQATLCNFLPSHALLLLSNRSKQWLIWWCNLYKCEHKPVGAEGASNLRFGSSKRTKCESTQNTQYIWI